MRLHLVILLLLPIHLLAEAPKTYPSPDKVRAAFLKALDRPKVPLDAKAGDTTTLKDGSIQETLTFASEKKAGGSMERVPVVIVRPAKAAKKLPAVIVLHGTGGNAKSQVGFMSELVKRGIIGVAIDARYHGDRSGGAKGADAYNAAIVRAWKTPPGQRQEHPFYFDTCWDLWRTVDYLLTREDIDGDKIGMIGFSMGGIQTWLAASVDERIKVAVPAIALQSFKWSLDNDQWQGRARTIKAAHDAAAKDLGETAVNQKVCRTLWNKIIPGILDEFDCPSMMRLFAGRPLLIVSGTKDANCPYEGAKLAIAEAEKAYKAAGASDKLKVMVEEVGHTVTAGQREAALDWFAKWLK